MMSTASVFLFLLVIFMANLLVVCFKFVCILLAIVEQAMNFRLMF